MLLRKFRSVATGILLAALAGCQTTDKPAPPPQTSAAAAQPTAAPVRPGARAERTSSPIRATGGGIARPNPLRSVAEIDADARALPTTRDGVYEALDTMRAQRGDGDAAAVALRYTLLGGPLHAVRWMQDAARFDGNSELVLLYAETTWARAAAARMSLDGRAQADELFEAATEATLLAHVLVLVDGARCVDTTGAAIRLQHLQARNAERLRQMAALPAARRASLRDQVRQLELNSSLWRREDPGICMDGVREVGRIEAAKGTARIQRPGSPAGQVEIVPGPDYLPEYLAPGAQIEAMHKARQGVVDFLLKLLP